MNDVGYATLRQLQAMEQLGGYRNAHRILHRMESDKLLTSVRREFKVYYLSSNGKRVIGSDKANMTRDKLEHTLMRNDFYIRQGMPKDWRIEVPVRRGNEITLISDAMYTTDSKRIFVEIDNEQQMRTNNDKIKKYAELFSDLKRMKGDKAPVLMWYVRNISRAERLRKSCEKAGVEFKIY